MAPQIPASQQNLHAVALHRLKHYYGCRSLHATTQTVPFAPARTEAPFLPTVGIWNVLCLNTKPKFNDALFITEAEACPAKCVASLHYTVLTCSLNCAKFPPSIQPAVYPRLRLSAFSFISCAIKHDAKFLFKLHLKPGAERGNSVRHAGVLQRHKHADGKRFASDAPLFIAPQTRSDIRAPIRGATQQQALVFKVSSSFEMTYELTGTADNSEGSKKRSQATTEPQVSTYR